MKTIDNFFPEFSNSTVVKQFYGHWPSLHDSEVIEITLNRELGYDFSGPKLRLTLYTFDGRVAPDNPNRKESKLILIFSGVELDHVKDFNHQNAMADFQMEQYFCDRLRQKRYRIRFGEFGAKVEFTCKTIEIESVEPYTAVDYFVGRRVK
jgi:hypothetical protein